MATLNDGWFLHPLTLDAANRSVPETLVAFPEDSRGRGIDLAITHGGAPVDTTGCTVLLAWLNLASGKKNVRKFDAVDASKGRWKCTYPTEMQTTGTVIARILVKLAGDVITSSREFNIRVGRVVANDMTGESNDDLSAFQLAVVQLEATNAAVQLAEERRASEESARVRAESGRRENEGVRIEAEEARAKEFARLKSTSEDATRAADEAASRANAAADNANASAATAGNVVAAAVEALSRQDADSEAAQIEALARLLRNEYGCFYLANTIWTKSAETAYAANTMTLSCAAYANGNITLG